MTKIRLSVQDLSKSFGSNVILSKVSLDLAEGEVLGISGGNGSGKSTLIKAIAGVLKTDDGTVFFEGNESPPPHIRFRAPTRLGVIFQQPRSLDGHCVLDNVLIAARPGEDQSLLSAFVRPMAYDGRLDSDRADARGMIAQNHGSSFSVSQNVETLSYGQVRRVELSRTEIARPKIILLDEPTAGIDVDHIPAMMKWVKRLAEDGACFLIAEHNTDFLDMVCTRRSHLIKGRLVQSGDSKAVTNRRAVDVTTVRGQVLIRVKDGSASYDGQQPVFDGFSFELRERQAVGFTGPNGSGKSTALKVIAGTLVCASSTFGVLGCGDALSCLQLVGRRGGIAYQLQGGRVFGKLTVGDNLAVAAAHLSSDDRKSGVERAKHLFPELVEWTNIAAGALSGGQRQILSFARMLVSEPRVILLDEPSVGLSESNIDRIVAVILDLIAGGACVCIVEHNLDFVRRITSVGYEFGFGGTPRRIDL